MQTAEVVTHLMRKGDVSRRPHVRDHAVGVGREAGCAVPDVGYTRDSSGGIAANKAYKVSPIGVS